MKPKTKLQKKVVAFSSKLKPITKSQELYAQEKLFQPRYAVSRNRNYCLECGHKFMPSKSALGDTIIRPTCPSCKTKNLIKAAEWKYVQSYYNYWAILTTVEDFQVVRMIMTQKRIKRKEAAQFIHYEVMQHWITPKGRIETMMGKVNSHHGYIDNWIIGEPLEVRHKSYNHWQRVEIRPTLIAKGRKVTPLLRRNGYKGHFYDTAPQLFFEAILKHQKAETLLKAKQIDLFKRLVNCTDETYRRIESRWPSICIAMRNNYKITEANTWLDYLENLEEQGKDLLNPFYVCPKNLAKEHQRYVAKMQAIQRREDAKKHEKRIAEADIDYQKRLSDYFDLHFKNGSLEVVPFTSVGQIHEESQILRHCIFTNKYYEREESLLFSARFKGTPIETVEVNLKNFTVSQARGRFNTPTAYNADIINLVKANMDAIIRIANNKKKSQPNAASKQVA